MHLLIEMAAECATKGPRRACAVAANASQQHAERQRAEELRPSCSPAARGRRGGQAEARSRHRRQPDDAGGTTRAQVLRRQGGGAADPEAQGPEGRNQRDEEGTEVLP